MAAESYLRIPSPSELDLEDLDLRLAKAARAVDLTYDSSETSGEWEVFAFGDIPPGDLVSLVKPVLKRGKLTVTGDQEITWEPPAPRPWINQNFWESTPYERALKRRIKALCADPEISAWWAASGQREVIFFMISRPGADYADGGIGEDGFVGLSVYTDISLLNDDHPTREALASESKRFLRLVLDEVATVIKSPRPRTPLLDD